MQRGLWWGGVDKESPCYEGVPHVQGWPCHFIPIGPFLPITPLTYHKRFLLQAPRTVTPLPCTDQHLSWPSASCEETLSFPLPS